ARLRGAVVRGVRVALLAGDRGDVDDAAVAVGDQVRHHRPAAQEGAGQVDVDNAAPLLGAQLPDLGVVAGNAGIVDQDVDLAEGRQGRLHGGLDGVRGGDIDLGDR